MTNKTGSGMIFLFFLAASLWVLRPSLAFGSDVRGTVLMGGEPPPTSTLTITPKKGTHSTEGCGSLQKVSQQLLVHPSGGIENVVVWLDGPAQERAHPITAVVMDQKECLFSPHVAVVSPGETLLIRNSDSVLHNVRIFEEGKPSMLMHQWQKADASDIPWRFTEPGRFVIRCGIHPWMYAWVVVSPGHGAVTDREGQFTISGVSPGRYTLHVWHETLGTREIPITVQEKEELLKPIRW